MVEKNTDDLGRGRPGKAYWLNEPQSLLVTMFARTPLAAECRKHIIEVFLEYRHGQLPPPPAPLAGQALVEGPAGPTGMLDNPYAGVSFASEEYASRRNLIIECRKTFGQAAAQRLWPRLGLPPVAERFAGPVNAERDVMEAQGCLYELLINNIDGEDLTFQEVIQKLLDGKGADIDRAGLCASGVRMMDDSFNVAAGHPYLEKIFADTCWANNGWMKALKCLPGAKASPPQHYGRHHSRRGVFIPRGQFDYCKGLTQPLPG